MEFSKFINVDQEDDCLSFRDLPIYSNAKDRENYNNSSEESQEEDLFEFFNQEWIKNQFFHHQDIIFCGKIIPQEKTIKNIDPPKLKNKRKIGDYITFFQGKKGLKSWYLLLFGISRSFSQEMKLQDLKRRQSSSSNRVSSLSQFQLRNINDEKKGVNNIRCNNHKDKEKGLWWLIKKLSCNDSSYHAKAVVKATISYIPQVM